MNFHPTKWSVYIAIAVFTALLGLVLTHILNNDTHLEIKQQTEHAKQYKATADSIEQTAIQNVNEVMKERANDSLQYLAEIQKLKSSYINQYKNYEAKLAAVNTLTYIQLYGHFSIHRMLSDSAIEVWRHHR